MDDLLKQRLVGAVIIVAMAVIFVPLLFDESPEKVSRVAESEGSARVPPVEEPPSAPGESEGRPEDHAGYRIIPLSDTPGSEAAAAASKKDELPGENATQPVEFLGDEGADGVEVPTRDSPLGQAARGLAVTPPTPGKAPLKKNIAGSPASGESSRGGVSAAGDRNSTDGGAAKPSLGGKLATTRGKVGSAASEPKKPASGKTAAGDDAPPAVVPSSLAAKPSAVPVPTKRENKKGVAKSSEPAKSVTVPKADSATNKKKTDAVPKTTVATAEPVATGNATPSHPSATATPKTPAHATSTVARKPKSDDTPTRWVVQTASFTNEANAKALVEKLRKNKFDAFIESVPAQGGVNYRVSVGPGMDKGQAEQARKRLKSAVGMAGTVTPHR